MAEAAVTHHGEADRVVDHVDTYPLPESREGLHRVFQSAGLVLLQQGTLRLLLHGRSLFATAPALIQVRGQTRVDIETLTPVHGRHWAFSPSRSDAVQDYEDLTVTPLTTPLDAARIGGRPIEVTRTRYGAVAVAATGVECAERFHTSGHDGTGEIRMGSLLWQPRNADDSSDQMLDVIIIGAGPNGLSAAAWAGCNGLSYRIFGEPLAFWKRHIAPLPLRSPPISTNIASPRSGFKYTDFAAGNGIDTQVPVSMSAFLAYAAWFSREHAIEPDPAFVHHLSPVEGGWLVQHSTGFARARNVVVAVGLHGMQRQPLAPGMIAPHWSYVADVLDFSPFSGRRVAVVGGGQSAIEAALLAQRAGAEVTVALRGDGVQFRCLHTPGEWLYRNLFKSSRHYMGLLPGPLQDRLLKYLLKGTVETSLEATVMAANLRVLAQARVVAGAADDACSTVIDAAGERVAVDHVLVAAGYDYDVRRIPCLAALPIRHRNGLPLLDRYAMSSQPGLFFTGMAAVRRYGPQAQFVFGSGILSPCIIAGMRRRATRA